MTNSVSSTVPENPRPHGPFASLRRRLPAAEVIRFLLVGGFNTAFTLVLYSGFVLLYSHLLPDRSKPLIADVAAICSKPIGITVAFLCYKHFVFRTKGNYLKELLRCFAVYGISTPAELIILPVATHLFLAPALTHQYAPFLAGIVNAGIIATYSYFAHKKFSFKQ
jgi:putative flippase GtrA